MKDKQKKLYINNFFIFTITIIIILFSFTIMIFAQDDIILMNPKYKKYDGGLHVNRMQTKADTFNITRAIRYLKMARVNTKDSDIKDAIDNIISILTTRYLRGDDFTQDARKNAYSFVNKIQKQYLKNIQINKAKQQQLSNKFIIDRFKGAIGVYNQNANIYRNTKSPKNVDVNKLNNLNMKDLNKQIYNMMQNAR